MPSPARLAASFAALAVVFALGVAAPIPLARAADESSLAQTAAALQSAFVHDSAKELRALLSADKKVFLDLPEVRRGSGFLGSDQVYYLFQSFFEHHGTATFAIPEENLELSGRVAFARAEWRYHDPAGRTRSVSLAFTFAEEKDRWVVTEIRAARS